MTSLQDIINKIKSYGIYEQIKEDVISFYDDCRHFGFRQRVFYTAFWPWAYNPTRKYYIQKLLEKETELFETNPLIVDSDSFMKNKREVLKTKKNINSNKKEPELSLPKMRFIPYTLYLYVSTTYHIYGIIQSILLIIIFDFPGIIDKHFNCYLLGRISLTSQVVHYLPYVQILSNIVALAYRLWLTLHLNHLKLDTLIFITAKEEEIRDQLKVDFDEHEICENWPIQKPTDNYLKDVLYLEVEVFDKTTRHYLRPNSKKYYLRPNRTVTAHKTIVKFMNSIWFWSLLAYWALFLPIQPIIVNAALFDISYIDNYPTCSPDLEELKKKDELSRWSVTLSIFPPNHRIIAGAFDVLNNCILWQENLVVLIYPPALVMLLTEDLIVYWESIRHKLDSLLNKMIYYKENDLLLDYNSINKMKHFDSTISLKNQKMNSYRHAFDLTVQNSRKLDSELEEEVSLLQRQIIDFFSLLKSYDRYVSLMATLMYSEVLLAFILSSYFAIGSDKIEILTFFRCIQFFSMSVLSIPTFFILKLRGTTITAYPILNRIMAYEKNLRRQLYWKQILEFYTSRPAYCFTILHAHPVDWMTYLNVVATSISCLVVFETYVRHRIITTVT